MRCLLPFPAIAIFAAAMSVPLAAQVSSAQETAEPEDREDGDIVVTGRRATRSDVSRQARQITRREGNPRRNPLARFEKPVCPGVIGMPVEWAEHLVGRMRYVAEQAGMDLAPEDTCHVNVLIGFVPNSQAGMRQFEGVFPVLFANWSRRERDALFEAPGPVHVATLSVEKTRDGFEVPPRRGAASPPVVSVPLAFSRIYLTTREDIEGVVLLFETRAVDGMSIVQLADYAAMRSFAETQAPSAEVLAMNTILTLFEPDAAPPLSLTEFDLAYLRSLYDGIANMPASTRTLGLNRQLRKMDGEELGVVRSEEVGEAP